MTPEQQKAVQGACEDVNLTGDERARLVMLIAANNVEELETLVTAWVHQPRGPGPIRYVFARAAQRAKVNLEGREYP